MLSLRWNLIGLTFAALVGALGCGSASPLNDGGSAGAGGRDASDGDRTMATGGAGQGGGTAGGAGLAGAGGAGTAGAGGTVPAGYCDTFADCELRSGCCGGSCQAKTDPPSGVTFCATSCVVPEPGPPTCGCVDHVCSRASSCIVPGTISCASCPAGYLTGADGCPTCQCKPTDAGAEHDGSAACTWPPALDAVDAGAGACHPSLNLLSCAGSNGTFEECASDNPDHCEGDSGMPGVTFTCHSVCAAHEYAAVCGSVGPGPIADPPVGCHNPLVTPAGIVFYCCRCL